ncbi:hypothetical protein Cni_G02754 [Canna indica]|uniref:Diacylglycerol kinase n=1 Tax=Canna indica TaxID=4628 RepID=A0AAQ3JRU9_9LILI|nr:hypothetical protein Cni_G02754 [Canna indica]
MSSSKVAEENAAAESRGHATPGRGTAGTRDCRIVLIPEYLRSGMVVAMRARDSEAGVKAAFNVQKKRRVEVFEAPAGTNPLVVFVNSRSGGGQGPQLKLQLQELISDDQVFDLKVITPSCFVKYGLTFLETFRDKYDDHCAKDIRSALKIMVAGGDGTIGWVLRSLRKHVNKRESVPPVGIIPLGTGNDLSRSFGWGGALPHAWKSKVQHFLCRAISNDVFLLDSWQIKILVEETEVTEGLKLPHSFGDLIKYRITQDWDIQRKLPKNASYSEGVFYGYFSIGMDAQVAYDFHNLRERKPDHAQSSISNKLIYAGYSCKQGWFFTPCNKTAGSSVRGIVFLNLDSYGGGSHPWGHPKPEYLEQAAEIKLELQGGGEWGEAYMQMDGEPWRVELPENKEEAIVVKVERIARQSCIISGKASKKREAKCSLSA